MCDAVENYAHKYAEEYAQKRVEENERLVIAREREAAHAATRSNALEGARRMLQAGLDCNFIRQIFPLLTAEDITALTH